MAIDRYLVAYDVSDDASRARLARLLAHYGVRVQYSVFECVLRPDELAHLVERSIEHLAPGSDRLGVYPQCEACTGKRSLHGRSSDILDRDYYVI